MTNHSVFEFPGVDSFPEVAPELTYNTFNRYRVLDDYVSGHRGKFSEADAEQAMSLVYGFANDSSEGAAYDLPLRTLCVTFIDVGQRAMRLRFYLRDSEGAGSSVWAPRGGEAVFAEPLEFKLG